MNQNKAKHLLVACIDGILQLVLSNVFKDAGYKVSTAKDGIEVLFFIQTFHITQTPFNLLLLDTELPDFNCSKLFKKLENLNITIPILFMSTPENETTIPSNFNNRIIIIEKPFSMEQVLGIIQEVLL